MRMIVMTFILLGSACAEESMWIKEEITDPSQLRPEERLDRARGCLEVLERWPEGDAARSFVGPLLMLRAELRGDTADRAAVALRQVTGEDYGTDFDRWQEWFDGVRATEKWKPTKLFTLRRNPDYVLEGPSILVVYSPEPPKEVEGGVRILKGPCAMRCARLGLYVRADDGLEIRQDSKTGNIELKSVSRFALSGPAGPRNGILSTQEIRLDLFGLTGVECISMEDLRLVPQEAEDSELDDSDPAVVMRYVSEQAQGGNFLPLRRVLGAKALRRLSDPEERKEAAEACGLTVEEVANTSSEELFLAMMRRDFVKCFLYLDVETRAEEDGEVRYTVHRFGGSSGGTLIQRDGKWRSKH